MILFKAEHIPMIHNGTKTETRRMWKNQRAKVGSLHKIKKWMFQESHHGLIRILDVRKEKLLDITEEGAKAEGGYTIESYIKKWFEINPKSSLNPKLFVIKFEYVGTGESNIQHENNHE